jgi:hypothetical protein
MFFYFRNRFEGADTRHFWRYIDSRSGKVTDNRFEIAQIIACRPDEPRFIGKQNALEMQERIIAGILKDESAARTKEVVAMSSDPIQTAMAQEVKDAIRRGSVDRELARAALQFLGQAIGRALIQKLKAVRTEWMTHRDDRRLIQQLVDLSKDYGKRDERQSAMPMTKGSLELVCFDHVSTSAKGD